MSKMICARSLFVVIYRGVWELNQSAQVPIKVLQKSVIVDSNACLSRIVPKKRTQENFSKIPRRTFLMQSSRENVLHSATKMCL